MLEDDGTDPFGDPHGQAQDVDWDTPEWRAEMEAKYGQAGG